MSPLHQRRDSDKRPLDIEIMIAEENDPRQRAFLIVLNSINNTLNANTKTTIEVAEKLDAHLTNYEEHTASEAALINKGIGAWKVIAWALGLAQAVLASGGAYLVSDLKSLHASVHESQVVEATLREEVRAVGASVSELRTRLGEQR